ncbi:ran-binding protein 3-like [Diadema antillarum]|uniref:ran-binding protein 3-like n=1 Tax=Diadema antillarum TaxID=105358 RepID=UPI003A876A13
MAQRTVLTPASTMEEEEEEEEEENDEGYVPNAKPVFKLNPPTLIHGQAKSAPISEDKEDDEQVKPLLRPSALNHYTKGEEEGEECTKGKEEVAPKVEGNGGAQAKPEHNEESESSASKRTNYFLRLTTGDNERDTGFGVFGKFRDHSGYRIGFEDSRGASGNSGDKNSDSGNHDGTTHENYFMQFARDKDLNSSGDSPSSLSSSSGSSFLFGQNMNERVTSPNRQEGELQSVGELVFGQNLSSRIKNDGFSETSPEKSKEQTLAENALALEEARQRMRRKFEDVESVTGEEDEENVVQSHCKLFMFDPTKRSWLEKGRGQIRVNDMRQTSSDSSFQSRLVMRTQGSLRLILNTKIWSGMSVERASTKSLRISAMDAETEKIKVFLISGTPKDIEQLYCAIEYRIQALKQVEEEQQRLEAEGTEGQASAQDSKGDANEGEEEEEDGEDDDDDDEDSEVAKINSRDRSKPPSPRSTEGNSASASPSLNQEES